MSIRFACPECGKRLETDDRFAGRSFACPRCGLGMIIPVPEGSRPPAEPIEALESTPPAEPPEPAPSPAPVVSAPPPSRRPVAPASESPLIAQSPKIDFEDLIDMTAMVDIVFFLLIFFLVTSMHALDSTIPMPVPDPQGATGGRSSSSADGDDSSIVVNIDRNDTIRIDGVEIHSPRDLHFKLRDLKNGPGRPEKLLVVGSSDASHGAAVMVLDAGHDVGMESVRLAVRDDSD